MTFRNSSKFKIRAAASDEDSLADPLVNSVLTEQIEYQRFEKLNQRVTIITILIPILIGIMIFIGYWNIRQMVSQTQDMGAKELTSLAQNLESTISNISIKQAKLEETLAGKIADQEKLQASVHASIKKIEATVQDSIKKMEATVQNSVKKTETSLAEIQAAKADKKDVAGEVSGMDSKLAAVQKDLKTGLDKLHADIKTIDKKMSDELAKSFDTVNNVTTRIAECQADISLLSAEKADRKLTEAALKNQEKHLQDQTNQLLRNLESKMESLNASIKDLERSRSAIEKNPPSPASRKSQSGPPSAGSGGSKVTIKEENIQE
jgi:septal ring factor EnvC (AmiA/AmiB activator)